MEARRIVLIVCVSLAVQATVFYGATYTVTTTNDSGPGSLREAIALANANPGPDLIAFNISGAGPHTIRPLSALPLITDPVTIDGNTQPGTAPATYTDPATLLIELDGTNVGDTGLNIWLVGNSTIRGLVINRFGDAAIHVHEGGGNLIEGNYIGTDVTGRVDVGNYDHGIRIWDSPGNMIGGPLPAARNFISGNGHMGIQLLLPSCTGNTIQGNYIGTDVAGTAALGNGDHGILLGEGVTNTTIGPGNVICSHSGAAIEIFASGETGSHEIVDNLIGAGVFGESLGNTFGIRIIGCSGNTVRDNTVSNNSITGISLADIEPGPDPGQAPADDNVITGNTISSNGGFGLQIEISNNNTIYNNNFIDNHLGTPYQVVDHGGTGNLFNMDKPIGGNYWSDWTAPDLNCDSTVDLPYPIWTVEGPDDYANQDRLPWACPDGWRMGCDCSLQPLSMDLVMALDLPKGIENSLVSKLVNAAKKMAEENTGAASNVLNAFINEIQAQRGKKILEEAADALIAAARDIIERLQGM